MRKILFFIIQNRSQNHVLCGGTSNNVEYKNELIEMRQNLQR
jgi:hypothetical protein